MTKSLRVALLLVLTCGLSAWAQDGYAAKVTGGKGGREVVATTAEALRAFAASPEPLVITIRGAFLIGQIPVVANKTLRGRGAERSSPGICF